MGAALAKVFDVAFNPVDIGLFGAQRIVQHPDARANLVEKARCRRGGGGGRNSANVCDGIHGNLGRRKYYAYSRSKNNQAIT